MGSVTSAEYPQTVLQELRFLYPGLRIVAKEKRVNMRWYKIEFFSHGTLPENRIRYVERQYSSSSRALAAANVMHRNFEKHGIECWTYTVTLL